MFRHLVAQSRFMALVLARLREHASSRKTHRTAHLLAVHPLSRPWTLMAMSLVHNSPAPYHLALAPFQQVRQFTLKYV